MNQNEAEPKSSTDSLPDRLLNPDDYESSLYTPQRHAEPTEGANEAHILTAPLTSYQW